MALRDLFPESSRDKHRRPTRAWLDARDVLCCLATEGQVLALAASDIADGRVIGADDAERISRAAGRVGNAWGSLNGHY